MSPSSRPRLRAVSLVVAAAGLLAAASGCATKGTPYHGTTPSAAASGGAAAPTVAGPLPSMSPLPAARGQLTGTQLAQVLLPASFFPGGFTAPSSGPVTSGGSLTTGPAAYRIATVDCPTFVYHLGRAGFGETALAAGSAVGTGQVYDQVVYQFGSAAAASAFVAGVRAVAARCGKPFRASEGTATGTFTLSAATGHPVGGHPSLTLAQAGKLGGQSLVLDALLVPSGVDVFMAAAVGVGGGAPAVPARETIAYNLMKRQAAAAALS